jgi:uncharacterized protein YbbC (DUF1343 family)
MEGRELAAALNASRLEGVRFVPVRFTPRSSKFQDEMCGGVNVVITARSRFDPVRTGLQIARNLRELFPDDWQTENLDRLLGNERVRQAILVGKSVDEMEVEYSVELSDFKNRREAFLLYD